MRHVRHELNRIQRRMVDLQERFAVQSAESPFRDLAEAVATLTEILLTFRDDGHTEGNYIRRDSSVTKGDRDAD